ncbi:helix-turn-helix domain-containing protein [Pseudorhizobium pelagicum]|uniref:helix-turn-helix domain-containing protein n=1 Tax=Pseudorhizobium pelagicum TaxID=1509405 RepID=UPI001FDA81D9|nr:helix-turn-helix domain-containing protein [Pseudorhizobium pelagicum]
MEKIKDTKSLGMLIRQERKQQGLTQEQLAGVIGVGVRFLRELGQRLLGLARMFNAIYIMLNIGGSDGYTNKGCRRKRSKGRVGAQ